jgi:hypothetical protein
MNDRGISYPPQEFPALSPWLQGISSFEGRLLACHDGIGIGMPVFDGTYIVRGG